MAVIPPTNISPVPLPAPQRNDRATFSDRVDAFITWLITAVTEFNNTATNVSNNASIAYDNASIVSNALLISAAQPWVSGSTYSIGDVRYSVVNGLVYRRRTNGAGTTDPSADPVNWLMVPLQTAVGSDIFLSNNFGGM
jgi:hypothetical protein